MKKSNTKTPCSDRLNYIKSVWKSVKNYRTFVLAIVCLTLSFNFQLANAAGNGSSPKGKPFIAINNQIVEVVNAAVTSLQDQIDDLVARVDTVELRVSADEEAIFRLQDQNEILAYLVLQNFSDITAIQAEITLLAQSNTDLQSLIATTSGEVEMTDLVFAHPILNVRAVERRLDVAYNTAAKLVHQFEQLGFLVEVTGQRRNRVYRFEPYLRLFQT